jgi:hypothetical protein
MRAFEALESFSPASTVPDSHGRHGSRIPLLPLFYLAIAIGLAIFVNAYSLVQLSLAY